MPLGGRPNCLSLGSARAVARFTAMGSAWPSRQDQATLSEAQRQSAELRERRQLNGLSLQTRFDCSSRVEQSNDRCPAIDRSHQLGSTYPASCTSDS